MSRKVISMILAAAMLCSIATTSVFAEDVIVAEDTQEMTSVPNAGAAQVSNIPLMDDTREFDCPYQLEVQDKLIAENDNLALYLYESKFRIKVLNKKTGYIWSSALTDEMTIGMNDEWKNNAQSFMILDYMNSSGAVKRCALAKSKKAPVIKTVDNGFIASVEFEDATISMDVQVVLEDDGITVSVPDESIVEKRKNKINRLFVLPFFGAANGESIPGYLFVPDGSGALMRFEEPRKYNSAYQQRIYGKDLSVTAIQTVNSTKKNTGVAPERISVPVYGAVHGVNQNGFAATITSGDEFCEINASPAGNIINYFWISPSFVYNEVYWQSTGSKKGFNAVQDDSNIVNPEVHFTILDGEEANYIGMANTYKNILKEQGGLPEKKEETQEDVPLLIHAFMAEPEKAMFGTKTRVMTTIEDVLDWTEEFKEDGVTNLDIALMGYEKGGYNGKKIGQLKWNKSLDKEKDFDKLQELLGEDLSLLTDISGGYVHQVKKSQVKYGMDGSPITLKEDNLLFTDTMFVNSKALLSFSDKVGNDKTFERFSLDSIAQNLYADYSRKGGETRSDVLEQVKKALETISEDKELSLKAPNAYAYSYIDSAYHVPTSNSQYVYFSESVPFLQTVMSGYIEAFSTYQNFGTNTTADVLKMIDFNTYPSYILTEEYSNKLSDSNMAKIYSSRYEDWQPYIVANYTMLNEVLSQVQGAEIVGRTVIAEGVSVTTYDNGKQVIVNYSDTNYDDGVYQVKAQSAIVKGV